MTTTIARYKRIVSVEVLAIFVFIISIAGLAISRLFSGRPMTIYFAVDTMIVVGLFVRFWRLSYALVAATFSVVFFGRRAIYTDGRYLVFIGPAFARIPLSRRAHLREERWVYKGKDGSNLKILLDGDRERTIGGGFLDKSVGNIIDDIHELSNE
jgi:hypothetical protein